MDISIKECPEIFNNVVPWPNTLSLLFFALVLTTLKAAYFWKENPLDSLKQRNIMKTVHLSDQDPVCH